MRKSYHALSEKHSGTKNTRPPMKTKYEYIDILLIIRSFNKKP